MIDKDKVRSVVARFFNVPETAVTEDFVFPPERLHGSVGRATFYAAIKRMAGADLASAATATTFRELFTPPSAVTNAGQSLQASPENPASLMAAAKSSTLDSGLGIDIEHCDNLPPASDPWTGPFFAEHFTPAEIAYCQRQPSPRESLCGIWCAKEAAIKSCRSLSNLRPIDLEIQHDSQGRPTLAVTRNGKPEARPDFKISISHSHGLAVAVCAAGVGSAAAGGAESGPFPQTESAQSRSNALAWLAFGLGLLNLILWLFCLVRK